jgi:hypothetical protein
MRLAGLEHTLSGLSHLRRLRVAGNVCVAERQAEVAWPHLSKADPQYAQNLLHTSHPSGLSIFTPIDQEVKTLAAMVNLLPSRPYYWLRYQ